MRHGLDGYWRELARFRRRLAVSLLAAAAASLLVALAAMAWPQWREPFADPERFGFEGPTQFVERIRLETVGPEERGGAASVDFVTPESRRGGRPERTSDEGRPVARREEPGLGEDELDWNARARMLRLDAPVIRSEELIALHLEQPEYPELALEMDLEGVVEIIAMIDTLGAVRQVQVFGGTRDSLFERAAIDAVFRNRYRPYLQKSVPQTVWVPLRYTFTIDRTP